MSAALDRLSELERAATPGPWECIEPRPYDMSGVRRAGESPYDEVAIYLTAADSALIAASRNALPALLAVARAAEACESEWTGLGALDGPDDLDDDFDALRAALAALDAP